MFNKLKENYFLRLFFYHLLKNVDISRKIKGTNKKLFFNAGTNLNLLFQKDIIIEAEITHNLKALINPDFTVYDIGANIGYYTILFSQFAYHGKVIAFEPDKFNFNYLVKNKEINKLSNVSLSEKGISSKSGISNFFQDINTGRTSSLEQGVWHPNATRIQEDTISITTLDEVSKIYGIPNLIKCDVEGHEVEVLKGAEQVLSYSPILMLEVKESNREEVAQILTSYNYQFFNAELPFDKFEISSNKIEFSNVLCIHKKYLEIIMNNLK